MFKPKVLKIIQAIPFGKVMSYGQVAAVAGVARAARQVGWILNQSEGEDNLPWWRVINNAGRISIKGTNFNTPLIQKKLLENEGIEVTDKYELDIEKYRFRPSKEYLQQRHLDSAYIERLIQKYQL